MEAADVRDIAISDATYFDWLRLLAEVIDGGEHVDRDGVLLSKTGAPQEWWNTIAVTRPLEDPGARLREAMSWFDQRNQAYILRVRDGCDPSAERAAEAEGMTYTDSIPGMVLRPVTPREVGGPPGLRIETVQAEAALVHCVAIAAEAFGMSPDDARMLAPMSYVRHPRSRLYLGHLDGRPVATSGLLVTGDIAGVYWVATAADFRRRGLGEAMTRHAVNEGVTLGCTSAALQASEMGAPIYERMGFRTVAQYRTYVPAANRGG